MLNACKIQFIERGFCYDQKMIFCPSVPLSQVLSHIWSTHKYPLGLESKTHVCMQHNLSNVILSNCVHAYLQRTPVPNERKDAKYWDRRKKNNDAAKRSRDMRRKKIDDELKTAKDAIQENQKLKQEIDVSNVSLASLSNSEVNLMYGVCVDLRKISCDIRNQHHSCLFIIICSF